jgi:hypothetical protein
LSCCRTLLSSDVAGSGQSRSSIAATARFCDAHMKSGGASPSAFTPSSACRLLSQERPRIGGVDEQARDNTVAGWHSCRSSLPSRHCSCTGTYCGFGSGFCGQSSPSSWWRLVSFSLSLRPASVSSSRRALCSSSATQGWFRVGGAAGARRHKDEAFTRGVAHGCLRCPPGCRGARGDVGHPLRVVVGHHRVVGEA